MKKTVFHNYQLSKILQPNGPVESLLKEEKTEVHAWDQNEDTIFNTNSGNVGIGIQNPSSVLDVSGCVNTNCGYTINYISIAPPVGSIMAYTMGVSPDGWLLCDGASINKITYTALYGVIGITFGGGLFDLSFNLPNYCGAFLRGIGSHNGYVGPSTISSYQTHATQTHSHGASSVVTDPGHSHSQHTINDDYNNNGGGYPNYDNPSFPPYDSSGSKTWTNINSSSTGISVSTTIANSNTSVDANETRPYNFGVYWIIKY